MVSHGSTDCYSCSVTASAVRDPREEILVQGGWRVAHAFDSALPGWLVVLPARHLTSLDELTEGEAAVLGPLLRRLSSALTDVVACQKTYLVLFAEAEGFSHLHIHVVPRMDWFTEDQVGPRVFSFLGAPQGERVSDADQDALCRRLQQSLAQQ